MEWKRAKNLDAASEKKTGAPFTFPKKGETRQISHSGRKKEKVGPRKERGTRKIQHVVSKEKGKCAWSEKEEKHAPRPKIDHCLTRDERRGKTQEGMET